MNHTKEPVLSFVIIVITVAENVAIKTMSTMLIEMRNNLLLTQILI